jgi:pullulanase
VQTNIAWIDDIFQLTVQTKNVKALAATGNPVIHQTEEDQFYGAIIDQIIDDSTAIIKFSHELPMGETLILQWAEEEIPIYPGGIVRTKWFDDRYSPLGSHLGADCRPEQTVFTIWAPTAASVVLLLNKQPYNLIKKEKGIWHLTVPGDWHGATYQYEVTVNGKSNVVNDPYAKAMLPNSKAGVVVELSRTDQLPASTEHAVEPSETIIYELHVRDATVHKASGVKNRGKFLGLTEKGTTTPDGYSTALSYLTELGCTHVQFLPVNDFARVDELNPEEDYNWGYDPLYFQAPEGSYSTQPEEPISRINELKQLIHTFHQEGLSVILDVVYNHVYKLEKSDFEKIVPGYYFRYHPDGSLSNGTGVGNDIASERQMVRKFILDTVDFWLREYKIDGFRFDLMGILDTETMLQIRDRTKQEKVPIMLLGEGWDMGTALPSNKKAASYNSWTLPGICFFNDFFRDSVKGELFLEKGTGYVNGSGRFIERMPHLVTGSALSKFGKPVVSHVQQSVNYVECHDNQTLWDRLEVTNPKTPSSLRKKMHQLATGITLLSQGIPFLHAGQEWFRTKFGDENSYLSGDRINQLDWLQREQETDYIEFVKQLIAFRKKHKLLRLDSNQEVMKRFHVLETPATLFGFTLLGDTYDLAIYLNPTETSFPLRLPYAGKWKRALTNHLGKEQEEIIGEHMMIEPYELLVYERQR